MSVEQLLTTGQQVLDIAKQAGATEADVVAAHGTEFEVKVADGAIKTLTQATSKGLGVRVFVGKRMGFCTTSDFRKDALQEAVERAVAMAKEAAEDPHNGLAEELEPGRIDVPDELDLYDPNIGKLSAEEKIAWAHAMEEAARAVDPKVSKFRDSGVATEESDSVLITSSGAERTARSSGIGVWCIPIATHEGELQTEMWYDSRTHLEDLMPVAEVGRTAGQRALRMLGAKSVKTQTVPVIFEPPMAAGLLGGMLGALNGDMVYKKASFLADKLGEQIAVSNLNVVDDPHLPRGAGSIPFDGEGLPTTTKRLVDQGKLTTFLYDSYTARKVGVKPTGNARRGYSSLPYAGVFNFIVEAGQHPEEGIIKDCKKGLLLTRGLGSGVNTVTGEYSRGANGLWIENGEVVHAVQSVTIAGDFLQLLQNIDALGNKVHMRGSSGAPLLRIAEMTVSGT